MTNHGNISVEGKIVEVRDGSKKVSRSYTYGYRTLRIMVGFEYYSVLVNTQKLSKYGFLPKVGQWVKVEGRLFPSSDGFYDASIKYVSVLKHIEPPEIKK